MSAGTLTGTDRRILGLAAPALGSLAVEPLYVLVDTAIVGRLGTAQLAGLAVAATVLSFVVAGSNFLTYGTTERVARRIGADAHGPAADVGLQAMWLAVLIGVPVATMLGVAARPLCALFGADGDALDHGTTYLAISAAGIPFVLVTLAAQGVLRGASDYVSPLRVLVIANVANLVLEVLFVYVLHTGIAGSAWSTVICQAAGALVFLRLVRPRLRGASTRRPNRREMAPLMSAGRHLLLRVGSMMVVLGGTTAVAGRIDEPTLAAHQIGMSLFLFLALSLDALAIPAQTLVAEDLGRGDRAAAAHVARRAAALSIKVGVALGVGLAAVALWVPYLFTDDGAVIDRATGALWWLAVMLVPGAIAFAHDGSLIGAGDYRFLGRAALGYLLAVAPLAALVLAFPQLGIAGIWGGLLAWMLLRAAVNHRRTATVLTA